jgi:patatin-related protein
MFKEELRLAVVIYGGASLAVYMHGVTKELLKLIRASKVLHEVGVRTRIRYQDGPDRRPADTEAVYFELLKRINRHGHFRVVLDVISGASAGAINGVMLGKAIVEDGDLGAQSPLWLRDADVVELLPRERGRYRKWYLYPFLKALSAWLPEDIRSSPETREKLIQLIRSAWFEPPFSGARLCGHFLDALAAMHAGRREGSTLIPSDQRLDVYASLTDLNGYPSTLRLHETLALNEREHAAFCRLSHVSNPNALQPSDFREDNLPALVWAARASSSYAGAFPPFHHSELKGVLDGRRISWPDEERFLTSRIFLRNGEPARKQFDPANRYFVDGGIVNNKPFNAALEALGHRSADRHVNRYVVYIEPDPTGELGLEPSRPFGYLGSIRAAVSTIPRNQPILDELDAIVEQDARVQTNRRLVEANRDRIQTIVDRLQAQYARQPLSKELIAYLRVSVAERGVEEMGLAFRAYVQRRVWRLTDALVAEWSLLASEPFAQSTREAMRTSVERWWEAESQVTRQNLQDVFLDRFDVTYRIRRLQFVIRRLNQHDEIEALSDREHGALEAFKRVAYGFLERLYVLRRALSDQLGESDVLGGALLTRLADAARQIPLSRQQASELLRALAQALSLDAIDREIDAAVFEFLSCIGEDGTRSVFLSDYVGFSLYDVLLFSPRVEAGGPDPLTPIRVERISPADSATLSDAFDGLKCRDLAGFLGFFNRDYREHDYLWGRLHGADRIVDLLRRASRGPVDDLEPLRFALFRAIIADERRRLYRCGADLNRIEALVNELERSLPD